MLANVVAQPAQQTGGGFGFFELLLPLALAFLIFTMFRKQRKMKKQVAEQRTQMVPGTEVMTNFGLFGTLVSLDEDNNKALIEISPGVTATVHSQALSKVVAPQDSEEDAVDSEASATVPDDASSLTAPQDNAAQENVDRTAASDSTERPASHETAETPHGTSQETPEETLERLNRENARERNDKDQ